MALSTKSLSGTQDYYPKEQRLQNHITHVWQKVVERFGYEAYSTPLIEPVSLYAKSGEEVLTRHAYLFQDRDGGHQVICPENTPSASRMVAARRQRLTYPLRWYSMPTILRYEQPSTDHLRERQQLNVDIFGVDSLKAEAELLQLTDALFKELGAKQDMYRIRINSRQMVSFIMHEYLGLDGVQATTIAKLINRMHSMPYETFLAEVDALFAPSQRESGIVNKLLGVFRTKQIDHLPEAIRNHHATLELQQLLHDLREARITNVSFDITMMGDFDYYTGIVFQVFDKDTANSRPLVSGGRYNELVGNFGVEPLSAVGFGCDAVVITNFLKSHQLLAAPRATTDVYVITTNDTYYAAQRVIQELRTMGANVAVDTTGGDVESQVRTAALKDIHYAMVIDEKDLAEEQYEVRNLITNTSERHSAARIVSIVKDYREEDDD